MKAHLQVTRSDRGFASLPAIPGAYGGEAMVYESSATSSPHIWLSVEAPLDANNPSLGNCEPSILHLDFANAVRLSEQLAYLISHHYQIKDKL